MNERQLILDQITFGREYTIWLLNTVDPADWLHRPTGCVTHVAWQVGHLASAEYRLALLRIRGERPEDENLIGKAFMKQFGADTDTDPDPNASAYPQPAEIRAVFDRVHAQALLELRDLDESTLDQPALRPHPKRKTKREILYWCAQHEFVHAGQIGLLRRLMGQKPLW
jgi:hypothetical protein